MEKKKLLTLLFCLPLVFAAKAQIRVFVNAPASIAREITSFSKPTDDGSWGFGNIDRVPMRTADVACVTSDTLACAPLPAGSLTGKIAVIHRGDCDFGCKVQYCQDAGAVGVLMINNKVERLGMLGNTCGPNVQIPVVLIDKAEGEAIKAALCAGGNVSIGTYRGIYANNIGIDKDTGAVSPPAASFPNGIVNDTARFRFTPGLAVENYGTAAQSNVKAWAKVTLIFSPSQSYPQTVYQDSVEVGTLAVVDAPASVSNFFFREFDLFTAMTGDRQGIYELEYRTESANADQHSEDNVFRFNFRITDRYFSLAQLNPNTDDLLKFEPTSPSVASLAPSNRVYKWGPVMKTPSLLPGETVMMDSVRLAVSAGDTVDFPAVQINVEIHKWADDGNGAVAETELTQVGNGLMSFADTTEKGVFKTIAIDDATTGNPGPIMLEPNTLYLILAAYRGDDIVEYSSDQSDFPYERFFNTQASTVISPAFVNSWFSGFTDSPVPAFRVGLLGSIVANKPGIRQIAASIYPNPAQGYVNVQLDGKVSASAIIQVQDLNGRTLKSAPASSGLTRISTSDLSNGIYQMVIRSAEGVAVRKFAIAK